MKDLHFFFQREICPSCTGDPDCLLLQMETMGTEQSPFIVTRPCRLWNFWDPPVSPPLLSLSKCWRDSRDSPAFAGAIFLTTWRPAKEPETPYSVASSSDSGGWQNIVPLCTCYSPLMLTLECPCFSHHFKFFCDHQSLRTRYGIETCLTQWYPAWQPVSHQLGVLS